VYNRYMVWWVPKSRTLGESDKGFHDTVLLKIRAGSS
jgi:hypothetical protein